MTPTTRLEGLLPADGPATKDDQIIAEAVEELREVNETAAFWQDKALQQELHIDRLMMKRIELENRIAAVVDKQMRLFALGAALGIAVGLLAGWVW